MQSEEGSVSCSRSLRPIGQCVPLATNSGSDGQLERFVPVQGEACGCGRPLLPGALTARRLCGGCLYRSDVCLCPQLPAAASPSDPDDPVGARVPRGELEEELPGDALPFHPEPDCPRCHDTGRVRAGHSKDSICTCPAGEALAWEVRNG